MSSIGNTHAPLDYGSIHGLYDWGPVLTVAAAAWPRTTAGERCAAAHPIPVFNNSFVHNYK
jgi:hypothetical protein